MRFVHKYALAIVGVLVFVWLAIVWLLDRQGRTELIIQNYREERFGAVFEFVFYPPPWAMWLAVAIGLGLIYWDVRPRPVSSRAPEQQRQLRDEFGNCTPGELRAKTKEVADGMRALEQQYRTARDKVLLSRIDWNATSEEKGKIWEANNKLYRELADELEVDFGNQFLAKARSLREAILAHVPDIAQAPNSPHFRGAAVLDNGRLAGPGPIVCAAAYLESLSRTLPG